ncbi:uncharacterized protein PV06_04025 [Exophiala oligosperma]|uniref:Polyprenal reductase n=1 Tax=Exophiala oligosperma TaxID=215243 RepID=A0A0D2DRQ0_9EURO|nr:uncharacterized protein PV06_04025 [Exophiala oligosperma]KIW45653.1 hypothetical protein PV06_04025 [Exophiala oligosperma]
MLDLIIWCTRSFYILSTVTIIAVRLIPDLKDRFLFYGARDVQDHTYPRHHQHHQHHHNQQQQPPSLLSQLLDHVKTWKVPHSWFIHFYILSLLLSTISIVMIIITTTTTTTLSSSSHLNIFTSTTTNTSPLLCSFLMFIQSSRRLLECFFLTTTKSTSRMWIGHYFIGLAFYFFINLAIYVEYLAFNAVDENENKNKNRDNQTSPSGKTSTAYLKFIYILLFVYCSYKQNVYHRYLSSLKKYTLPDKNPFQKLVAPHYTAECGIYLSLVLLETTKIKPDGYHGNHVNINVNWSLICALLFVMVNLGVTADGTRTWMMTKFPERRKEVETRWRMIPPFW